MTHRLHIDVCAGDLVNEAALADIRVAADQQRPRVGIDRRETRNVLPDLFEVRERVFLPLHDGRHAAECGPLELLAPVERVAKLDQADVVLRDLGDEVARRVELAEGELVVVLIVQDVEEGGEERVEVLQESVRRLELKAESLTSRTGNSEMIRPSFSSNVSWVNLILRM
jgi:hypothetical protein